MHYNVMHGSKYTQIQSKIHTHTQIHTQKNKHTHLESFVSYHTHKTAQKFGKQKKLLPTRFCLCVPLNKM